jgi:hypothetical protein
MKALTLLGREWLRLRMGCQVYHTAEILVDGIFVHKTEIGHGSGMYEEVAKNWLNENGFLPKLEKYEGIRKYCDRMKVSFISHVFNVNKRDL